MKRYTFDTNFLVSLLNDRDINHQKAKDIAKTIHNDYIIIPSVVIAEIMSYTKNEKLRDIVIKSTMETLSEISFLSEENLDEYIKFRYQMKRFLTAIDSIVLYSAISTNSELITFDKKLEKLYKSMI